MLTAYFAVGVATACWLVVIHDVENPNHNCTGAVFAFVVTILLWPIAIAMDGWVWARRLGIPRRTRRSKLIGLTGYAQSGKDEACKAAPRCYERVAFADAVRDALYRLNPVVEVVGGEPVTVQELVNDIGWDAAKQRHLQVRAYLQRMGTEVGRDVISPSVWTDIAERKIRSAWRNGKGVILTDVRFVNEADLVKRLGGELWAIERPGVGPVNSHVSDAGVRTISRRADRTLRNDGTLDAWQRRVRSQFPTPKK